LAETIVEASVRIQELGHAIVVAARSPRG